NDRLVGVRVARAGGGHHLRQRQPAAVREQHPGARRRCRIDETDTHRLAGVAVEQRPDCTGGGCFPIARSRRIVARTRALEILRGPAALPVLENAVPPLSCAAARLLGIAALTPEPAAGDRAIALDGRRRVSDLHPARRAVAAHQRPLLALKVALERAD